MAHWTQILYRFRFLFVAGLVAAILSTPLLTEAGSRQKSSISIVEAPDLMAGMSAEWVLQGKSYQNLEVALEKPDQSVLILETVTDAIGRASLQVSDYHLRTAGLYSVSARVLGKNTDYGAEKGFEVFPGTVSETVSTAELSKNAVKKGETVELTVTLQDAYENPIEGHVVKTIPSKSFVSVYSPEFTTNKDGKMSFYLSSDKKGIFNFTIFDSSINKTLNTQAKVAFDGDSILARGGDESVDLADESGTLSAFLLEITSGETSGEVEEGDYLSIRAKAVDGQGYSIPDYSGSIRFSSTDSSARLPNDYSFVAEDQGEHEFTLAVKLLTLGEQTITVTDLDNTSITGEVTITVVNPDENSVDYDEDFETTDYEREGDFTLISPASGSYSSDTLEVQGEAEYGYSAVVYLNEEEMARTEIEYDNSFTAVLEDLEDGTYELYVDIVELGEGDPGEEEILEVLETSDLEEITIDTTPPELIDLTVEPSEGITTGQSVGVTVLSEKNLEEASLLFQEELYPLKESSTSGKYEGELIMPEEAGDYTLDIILMDSLGNEIQLRDQWTFQVAASTENGSGADTNGASSTVLSAPTGLTVTGDEETVYLSWEAAESTNTIAFYRVYYGPSEDSLFAVSETYDASTNWKITDLKGEELYYFAVSAVDVEGTEGPKSETEVGIPLMGRESSEDTVDDTSSTPEISGSEEEVEATPETGPAHTMLLLLSALAGLITLNLRKRAVHETF